MTSTSEPTVDPVGVSPPAARTERRRSRSLGRFWGIWIATAALVAVCAVVSPGTLKSTAILSMVPFAAILAIAAVGETLVIQQRGIDLSVAGMMSLTAVLVTRLPITAGWNVGAAFVVAVCVGLAVGALVGLVITKLHVTPLVATLAVNAILVGVVRTYSGGFPSGAAPSLSEFALDKTAGIPNTVLVAVAVIAVVWAVVRFTALGRRFVAVGANPEAARAAGIRVDRYYIGTYAAAACAYVVAGTLLAGYVKTPSLDSGNSYLLPAIAAVVVGGTPLTGGIGSVVATAVAALFLSQLVQLVLALGAPTSVQLLVQSVAIAVAVILRDVRWRFRRRPGELTPSP